MNRTGRTSQESMEDMSVAGFARDEADITHLTDARKRHPAPLETVDVGQRIDEFDLLTGLGTGAFARVFLARQRSMQRLVAVKISEDHGREPEMLAQLDHDYIVRVFDQRRVAERGLKLLYMQYVPGGTLLGVLQRVRATPIELRNGRLLLDAIDRLLEEKGELRPSDSSARRELASLTWPETVAWLGRRLAIALDYAGRCGVLHRDVKPANVLLTADGIPKLADFNISFSGADADFSAAAYFGGSLSYMSPEQLEAAHPDSARTPAELDTRSDIYSLGVVLWELLTGRKPFDDVTGLDDEAGAIDGMLDERRRGVGDASIARIPPGCPATLRRVLLRCLAPERADRWRSGAALAQQFDLAMDPHARDLVDPPRSSWRYWLRPWSILIMELGVVVPSLLATYFNYRAIRAFVVDRMPPSDQHTFLLVWGGVTVLSFGVTALAIVYIRRYLVLVPFGLRRGRHYDPAVLARTRTDALLLGDRIVLACLVSWVIGGGVMGVLLYRTIPEWTGRDLLYFAGSVAIWASAAVVYPFFLVTYYAVRSLYPTFLPHGEISGADAQRMRRLRRRCARYLAVAAAVPLVSIGITTLVERAHSDWAFVMIRILCVVGVVAFVGAYWLFRQIDRDLRALARVTSRELDSIKLS